jgi:two-component system cell cycle sensor histidine kinase/response regulator CckA
MTTHASPVVGLVRGDADLLATLAARLTAGGSRVVFAEVASDLAAHPDVEAVVLGVACLESLDAAAFGALCGADAARPRAVVLVAPADVSPESLAAAEARGVVDWVAPEATADEWRRRIAVSCARARRGRAEAEARTRLSRMLVDVQRAARLGCYVYSTADDHCVATDALQTLLGLPPDHPTGQRTFLERVHPEDRDRMIAAARKAVEGGRPVEIEHRLCPADRDEIVWALTVIEVEHNADGTPRVYKGISQDVTARRRWDAEHLRFQKLQAIGQLAGGVAHEFNNLLAVILMNASVLLRSGVLQGDDRVDLEQVVEAGQRGKVLTRQLLSFGDRSPSPHVTLDLNALLGELARMMRRLVREDVVLEIALAPTPAPVRGDPAELEQAILNLVMNAQEAVGAGGHVTVSLARVEPEPIDGPEVCLRVEDDGAGISPETLAHLFEPFFTTKGVGEGPGLGLAAVYGIVSRHGGRIDVRSRSGPGSAFEVFFPLQAASTSEPPHPAPPGAGPCTVLVAEDEAALRKIIERVLVAAGHRVLLAPSAEAALDLWAREGGRVDVLLTDIVMPGAMRGDTLAEHLRRGAPHLPIVLMTGHADAVVGTVVRGGRSAVLRKPFLSGALLEVLASVRAERAP